jgi:hypothetical protein
VKLQRSSLKGRKAIVIYGFASADWPLEPAIDAFEALAASRADIGIRSSARFEKLVHPVHSSGGVFAWELLQQKATSE